MRNLKGLYLSVITLILFGYYLLCAFYLNKLGYFNMESLFYIEKSKIVFEGLGDRLKVMGLTAPIIPFYGTFVFTVVNYLLAPVIASALGTAILFYIMASNMTKRLNDDFYLLILLILFALHPGMLYCACSGKSIYMVLIFFFLFFFNLIKFYTSNTTFHISIASICLLFLVFCDYKFIWLTLFFIPLVLSITLHSLNLSEKESIFRLFLSFNNPALRRKLISKTIAIYIIIFILPITSVVLYKLLNLTHANDLNYFLESPYSTWTVLSDRSGVDVANNISTYKTPQASLITTVSVLWFCPTILVALYLFRQNTYHVLTLLTPFAFIEFLQIKFDNVLLTHVYFIIFLILSLLCIIFKAKTIKNQLALKIILSALTILQIYTGYVFLSKSNIDDERNFVSVFLKRGEDEKQIQNRDMASYINSLPGRSHILIDDAIAYPIVSFTDNIQKLTLPYQEVFLSALESPSKYADYMLLATDKNKERGYTQLNSSYLLFVRRSDSRLSLQRVFETDDWILYKILQ